MTKGIQRNFIIGDDWLYYKIYTGRKTTDYILVEVLKPIIEKLIENKIIINWFFIRYEDPKHHIRLRFNLSNDKNLCLIIDSLKDSLKNLIEQDLVWKVQIDTYQREIERYGEKTIELAEELFFIDSQLIVIFLSLIEGNEGEEIRWLFSLYAIDILLDNFNYSKENKLFLLEQLKTGFGNEFGMNRNLKKQLDNKYRIERKKIETFLDLDKDTNSEYILILESLEIYSHNLRPIAKRILQQKENLKLDNLISSFIHMTMNRLFVSKNRFHEMVVYDFLYRYYKSMVARSI